MSTQRTPVGGVVSKGMVMAVVGLLSGGCAASPDESQHEGVGIDSRWMVVEGGIGGPATRGDWNSATAEPHVECGLDDVYHDDIDDLLRDSVPDVGWNRPRLDEPNRCGDDFETLLFRLANCERRVRSLPELECDLRLVWAGREHSNDMDQRDFFGHETPDGVTPDERLNRREVEWSATAENLAQAPTMALVQTGWMESAGHRETTLRTDITHFGVGVVKTNRGYLATAMLIAL